MKKITKRQFEIAGYIRDFIGKNAISPTLYDIAGYFSIKPSTAAAHVAALERKHVIVRQKGRRRSIRPVGMGSGLPKKVPLCVPFYMKSANISGAPSSYYHVDASLLPDDVRASWRWRIILLRTVIDMEFAEHGGLPTAACDKAFAELIQIYHAQRSHAWVKSPISKRYKP